MTVATAAHAEGPRGVEIGLASGYSVPSGRGGYSKNDGYPYPFYTGASSDLHDWYSSAIPLRFSLGWREPAIFVGAFVQYDFTNVGAIWAAPNRCNDGAGSDLFFGVEADVHILPTRALDPWFGIELGIERDSLDVSGPNCACGAAGPGIGPIASIQSGLDFDVGHSVRGGPFVAAALGDFVNGREAIHTWLTVGLRVAFNGGLSSPGTPTATGPIAH
ncbi:MAG: hypothetical protein ACHREM_18810 [Polyangiales bacterium]